MTEHALAQRVVVLGRNSKVWALLKESPFLTELSSVAIGHAELSDFEFRSGDNVWVFSYSRSIKENKRLIEILARQPDISVIYVSSASTNVTDFTRCYKYPMVKQQARDYAVKICAARVVNIGWFYADVSELPAGRTAATSVDMLARAMHKGNAASGQIINLFDMVDRPFISVFEKSLYQIYGLLLKVCGHYPCFLRPLDFLLRMIGMRWYGYLYLSNSLWFTTI